MLKSYLKTALRNLWKYKGYSFINITGLAVGMACCILILLWVQDELSYDRFHANADRLYRTYMRVEGEWWSSNPLALVPVLVKDYPEIEGAVRYAYRGRNFRIGDAMYTEMGAFVGEDFFEMFSFPFIAGDPETAFESRTSIVISEDFADRFFQEEDPLGKIITMDNQYDLTVTGVLRNVPHDSWFHFDFLAPIQLYTSEERLSSSWSVELYSFLLLRENTDIAQFRKKIEGVVMKYDTRMDHEVILDIQPVTRMHLHNMGGGGSIIYVYIFSTIAVLILLIACINFINLATARSVKRAREIGVRKVLGAAKSELIWQFYGESMVSTFAALVIALLLVFLLLPSFNTLADKRLAFGTLGGMEALPVLFGITLFTGIVAGSYPSLLLSSFQPVSVLKASFKPRGAGINLRRALIVFQFTATIILIAGTLIIYNQLQFIRNKDIGLNREHVVAIPLNRQLRENYRAFKEELKQHPGVVSVTCASSIPTMIGNINPVYWEGNTPDDYVVIDHVVLDYDYFEAFEMEMVYGRSFSEEFPTDAQDYIINETALKLTGLENPIGKMFSIWEDEGEIIGVVKDFNSKSLHTKIPPTVFTLRQKHISLQYIFARILPEHIPGTMKIIENLAKGYAPGYPFEYTFVDESFDRQYRSDQRIGTLFRYFAVLAIFVSCLGLLGMASFMAEQRTREIGVRKVFGASVPSIVLMLNGEFMKWVTAANLIALPLAWWIMQRWLEEFAYRTEPGWGLFALTALFSFVVATIAVSWQAVRAARTNPIDTLRYE